MRRRLQQQRAAAELGLGLGGITAHAAAVAAVSQLSLSRPSRLPTETLRKRADQAYPLVGTTATLCLGCTATDSRKLTYSDRDSAAQQQKAKTQDEAEL